MKKLLTIVILFSSFIFLNGCYTIVNYSGSYTHVDNSETIIINNPLPPPPPLPVSPVIIYPDPPRQPVTKERINEERPKNSSGDRLRDSGGRGNDNRNNNRSSR